MRSVVLVIHNVRSSLNVGSLLRTAEGIGVSKVFLTGYTPYPELKNDSRLPHVRKKVAGQLHKTALGAEFHLPWQHLEDIGDCIRKLRNQGNKIIALEQSTGSIALDRYEKKGSVAIIVGNETTGIDKQILEMADTVVHIPMQGKKESFNVAVAAAIALYHFSRPQ